MPFHSPRQIPSHPKSLAKSHLNLHQISLKKRTIHPLEFLVAGKDVPLKNPHILLMEEILHHMLFMKPYENWDKLPYQLSIPSINSITHALELPAVSWRLVPSAPRLLGTEPLETPNLTEGDGGKENTVEFPRFFLVKTQRGCCFFFSVFFYWLVGLKRCFFSNPSGSFWWKSLDLEGCNCGLFWGGGDKMTSFLGQKP